MDSSLRNIQPGQQLNFGGLAGLDGFDGLKTFCRKAKIGSYTVHDLRRSCITNWARELPIHVVQKLAGHSDIRTTQRYYLSIQSEDLRKARRVQSKVLGKILEDDLTDPKLTHSGQKRAFPGRKAFPRKT